jgi:exoribonuclease R
LSACATYLLGRSVCLLGQVLAELPPAAAAAVGEADLAARRDLRALRVLSIDPPSARDLDDALSVERLPEGGLRIGVHIADVSHFVRCAPPPTRLPPSPTRPALC